MKRLADGDRSALEFIYQATSAKLFGICLRILGERNEAEDALQDVYINLWRSADRYDPDRASPISWLAILARNRAIDRLRTGKVQRGAVPVDEAMEITDNAPLADAMLETEQRDAKIHHCLGELEQRQQDAIRTAFFNGATYAQLAEARDVPLGTMKSWVRRGLAKLKRCLEI
ncbi:sigma-70 family RNA polymerase sigma factor [Pontixanthobacter aestiaquae]|uniref:Sigma-70 family RNA polymerase sigma factor n=1 Tax=Pontixanthobacter aestiaquae TaxID=1509367 RepID=A0A844Z7S8_9SPHN|nr:sigma-70 family RNA polymerase sigma factor [Pontixanthobacter aestiaquae]MDN3646138.1 sigma-70 family RNA polymerase sigma factor [Pontixanthobacter aestiaquae]MXO82870.1 sigma-70 family RNA polymerase sigma factor [Pontixanthobacter aestiaquae]